MAFPVFNRHRSEAFDQNSLGKKVVRGFVGQRLTGNRGSFFLSLSLRNFGKGGWPDWNQRTTERGQEPTSKTVISATHTHAHTHAHTSRSKTGDASSLFFPPFLSSPISYTMWGPGARRK